MRHSNYSMVPTIAAAGRTLWMLLLLCLATVTVRADDFLDVDKAFRPELLKSEGGSFDRVRIDVARGYYLYRDRLWLKLDGVEQPLTSLPAGEKKFDEAFGKEMEVYHQSIDIPLPAQDMATAAKLELGYQGCADAGLCYPPQVFERRLAAGAGSPALAGPGVATASGDGVSSASIPPPSADDEVAWLGSVLRDGALWRVIAAFFVAGVLLSLTPCVLPMLPILSSIILGQTRGQEGVVPRWRGLSLAATYSLGMALVYSGLGVAAGLAGEGLGAALQKPAVLLGFGLALVLLSGSMFGLYELSLPQAWTQRWTAVSQGQAGGRYLSVFLMGAFSALIVSPCVAAPLAGALIYISQSRDGWLGGTALFALASGMSVPLLLLGASAGTLLPRAGAWMESVKRLFGLLLLAVALWTAGPALAPGLLMACWGAWFMLVAVMCWPQAHPAHHGAHLQAQFARAAALVLGLWGALVLWGAASGGKDPLQPLALREATAAGKPAAANAEVQFMPVRSVAELDAALAAADRTVLLDFYADWCRSCIEMERKTYSQAAIAERMNQAILLKVDVTANTQEHQALLKRYGLFGPPAILFFKAKGGGEAGSRVIGFEGPEQFAVSLAKVGL